LEVRIDLRLYLLRWLAGGRSALAAADRLKRGSEQGHSRMTIAQVARQGQLAMRDPSANGRDNQYFHCSGFPLLRRRRSLRSDLRLGHDY
jgi:hypothetical protein